MKHANVITQAAIAAHKERVVLNTTNHWAVSAQITDAWPINSVIQTNRLTPVEIQVVLHAMIAMTIEERCAAIAGKRCLVFISAVRLEP